MVKSNKISTFWIIFLALLFAFAIGVAGYTYVTYSNKLQKMQMSIIDDESVYKIGQENVFKQSLYQACENLQQIHLLLGKVLVSTSTTNQAQMLNMIAVNSQCVEQCLSNLPVAVSDNYYACTTFANQVGDYSSYLIGRLAEGQLLSSTERSNLMSLDNVAKALCLALTNYTQSDAGMYVTNGCGADGCGKLSQVIEDINQSDLCYNQLSYNGNYGSLNRASICCNEDIGVELLQKRATELFGKCNFVDTLQSDGCTLYDFDLQNGRVVLTQDGNVLLYQSYVQSQADCQLEQNQAKTIAKQFCNKMGYNVQPTWVKQDFQNSVFVYCYPVVDAVTVYPRAVVVEVDCATSKAVGLQARAYLAHKAQQNYTFGNLSQEQAFNIASRTLKVTNITKALWQKFDKQYACYQIEGSANGQKFVMLIDSVSGKEIDVLSLDACTGQIR